MDQWFAVPGGGAECVVLTTRHAGGRVVTQRGTTSSHTPEPPEIDLVTVAPEHATAAMVRDHRARVTAIASAPTVLRTLDEIGAAHVADQRTVNQWRAGQGLALFEPMLRGMLGDEYEERGAPLIAAILRHPEWWDDDGPTADGGAMADGNQLGVPADIATDPESFEFIRSWSTPDGAVYVLDVRRFPGDAAVWGIVALDVMKHAARAYEQAEGRPREDVYKEILAGFMAEMQEPSEPL